MMTITSPCLCAAALLALSTQVAAQGLEHVSHTVTIPPQNTNWSHTITLPRFDPGLGTLQTIEFVLEETVSGHVQIESLDVSPSVVSTEFGSFLSVLAPDGRLMEMQIPMANYQDTFTAHDGIVDFGGQSGVTHKEITVTSTVTHPLPVETDLAAFTGDAGAPGLMQLTVTALGSSISQGSGNLITQFAQEAEAVVTVSYGFIGNTPPTFTNCPPTQMASVGVPLSFQICASDSDTPTAPVTLTVTGLPAGATLTPTLPTSGNPVCTTFNWTPTNGQIGSTVITFTATDSSQRTATCQVTIIAAECHLVLGMGLGNAQELLFGHLFDTQLSSVRRSYPVTMEDMPALPWAALPQTFFVQVLMHNPQIFPTNPDQWTYAMRIDKVLGSETLKASYFGTENGIHVSFHEFTDTAGVHRVRFPFTIDGM